MRVLARKAVFRREIFSERIREKDLENAWTEKGVAMIPPWPRGFDESQSNEHTYIHVWMACLQFSRGEDL